jgi:hypothetical protein
MRDLARLAGAELTMYPREKCGNLHDGADPKEELKWLDQEIEGTDYLIISADGLCSGGLVQARLGQIDWKQTISKLEVLSRYKKKYPNLRIYLFDTIMRTTITSYGPDMEIYWGKMNEFSRLTGRVHFFHDPEEEMKLEELKKEIPASIVDIFLNARRIKHELNKYFLGLVSDKVLDYMILLQEDAMPYGIQKIEQEILQKMITEKNLGKRVKFYNGTDEGGAVLLGKILMQEKGITPKLYLHLPEADALNKVMLFEDQPFSENLANMMDTMGFLKTKKVEEADFILSVYAEKPNVNLNTNTTEPILPLKNKRYFEFIRKIDALLYSKKPVALVDLLFPNGGSPDLLLDLEFSKLKVYSAWNTASNAMGSALCEIASHLVNPKNPSNKFRDERFLDDCLYQYTVRRIVNEKYLKLGYNVYDLGNGNDLVLSEIKTLMDHLGGWLGKQNYKITLPWQRTFEAEIEIEEKYEI